jgi:hypothetical protein
MKTYMTLATMIISTDKVDFAPASAGMKDDDPEWKVERSQGIAKCFIHVYMYIWTDGTACKL